MCGTTKSGDWITNYVRTSLTNTSRVFLLLVYFGAFIDTVRQPVWNCFSSVPSEWCQPLAFRVNSSACSLFTTSVCIKNEDVVLSVCPEELKHQTTKGWSNVIPSKHLQSRLLSSGKQICWCFLFEKIWLPYPPSFYFMYHRIGLIQDSHSWVQKSL